MVRYFIRNERADEQGRRGRVAGRWLALLAVFVALPLITASPAWAAGWQDAERLCLRKCPTMPRYGGIENDAQYKERMRKQAAHDQCFMDCTRKSSESQERTFVPLGEAEVRYFKRNGAVVKK